MALLPHADLAPPRDPLVAAAVVQPPPELAQTLSMGRASVPGSSAKLDVPVSATAAALILFAGMAPMFGGFGSFEEVDLLTPGSRAAGVARPEGESRELRVRGGDSEPIVPLSPASPNEQR